MKKHGKKIAPITKRAAAKPASKKKPVAAIAPASKLADTRDVPAPSKKVTPAPAAKSADAPRVKLVRDSFTMPREDFELVAQLKARALEFKRPTKKSELLRAGLQVLARLSATQLQDALASLRPLPSGRPKKKR